MPMMLQDLMDQLQQGTLQPPDPSQLPPGTPPNGLLANLAPLIKLGSVDQRHKLFQQQYDQAGQTAAGAPVDYSHGKGAPLALAGLVNLVSAGLGGYQQGKATGGLRDLVKEQDTTRTDAASSALNAPTPDFASLLSASQEDLPAKTQAAQQANDGRRRAGMMLSLSGDQVLGPLGKALYGDAERGQETMLGMPGQRQELAGRDVKNQELNLDLAAKLRAANVSKSQIVAGAGKRFLKAMGHPVEDDASPEEVAAILPGAREQYKEENERRKIGKFTVTPTGDILDTHSGTVKPGGGTSGTGGLTPEAIEQAARAYLKGGTLPSLGKGNLAAHTAILKRAAEISPDGDIVGNKATAKADAASLNKAQVQADSIESFESTALKNLDNFLATAKSISDTGIPILNKPIRAVADSLGGSPAQAQFNTARQVAIQEISKVLGGFVSGGAISDSQRHEVEGLMRGDATIEQLQAVAQTLKQDMANRKTAVASQIATIKGRMSGKPAAETPAPEAAPGGGTPQRKTVRGKTYEKRADGWHEVTDGQGN